MKLPLKFVLNLFVGTLIFFGFSTSTHAIDTTYGPEYFLCSPSTDSRWGNFPFDDRMRHDAQWWCDAREGSASSVATIVWQTNDIDGGGQTFHYRKEYYNTDTWLPGTVQRVDGPNGVFYRVVLNNLDPSTTYRYEIRSGSDPAFIKTESFKTHIGEGLFRFRGDYQVRFQVQIKNGVLEWQTNREYAAPPYQWEPFGTYYPGCSFPTTFRLENYACSPGDYKKAGDGNSCNQSATFRLQEWSVVKGSDGGGQFITVQARGIRNNNCETDNITLKIYAPGPPPLEVEGQVSSPVSITQGGGPVTFPVRIRNISEGGTGVPGGAAVPRAAQLSFPNPPTGLTLRVVGNSSCTPPQTSGESCNPDLQASVEASLQATRGRNEVTGEVNGRKFKFSVDVGEPKPKIVIQSTQLDDTRIYRETILSGQAPSTPLVFSVLNTTEGSVLDFRVSSNVSWLSLGSTAEKLEYRPGSNTPPLSKPITVTLRTERLPVQSHKGTITIADVHDSTIKAEIVVELTVTNISDFSLSVTSPPALVQGNSVGARVVVTRTTGVASDVALSVSGLPTGVTGEFVPAVCSAAVLASSCTSVLTLSADSSAALGPKTVTITAKKSLDQNGPAREQKKTFTLTVSRSFGVSLALSPASLEVQSGRSGTVRVLATLSGEGSKDVKFAVDGLPGGASGTFTPASCTQTCTSSLTLNAGTAGSGTSALTIKATGSDGKSATGALSFTIKALATATPRPTVTGGATVTPGITPRPLPTGTQPPGGGKQPLVFSLITVKTLSVIQGSMTNTSIILSHDRGDAESVRLEISQVPAHVTTSLSLTQCVPSCYSVLTLKTTERTPLGNSNIKITASSGQAVRTAFVELIVGTDPPPVPTALLQKNVKDGAQVGVGGTVREDRIVFSGTLDSVSAQKVRLRVEAKPVKEFFNGVTGVFEESTRLTEKGSSYELTGSKLLGGYKWRAQTVDERGIASPWVEFGRNGDSESDFITDLSTPPTNPFEANQGDPQAEEQPGFFRRIFSWVCYIPLVGRMCN